MHKCITYVNVNMQMYIGERYCVVVSVVIIMDFGLRYYILKNIDFRYDLRY